MKEKSRDENEIKVFAKRDVLSEREFRAAI